MSGTNMSPRSDAIQGIIKMSGTNTSPKSNVIQVTIKMSGTNTSPRYDIIQLDSLMGIPLRVQPTHEDS